MRKEGDVDRLARVFAATTIVVTIVAVYLWQQLRDTRALSPQAAAPQVLQPSLHLPPARMAPTVEPATVGPELQPPAPLMVAQETASTGTACDVERAQARQLVSGSNAAVIAELDLSPEEAERFVDLLMRQFNSTMSACRDNAPPLTAESLWDGVEDLLGPTRFQQYEEISAKQATRQNIQALRGQLATTAFPLSDEQAGELSATILGEQRRTRAERRPRAPAPDPRAQLQYEQEAIDATERRFERILYAAQTYLRPEQLALLDSNMKRQISSQRAQLRDRQVRFEAGGDITETAPIMVIAAPTAVRETD
jgi:hypothetical protein